MTQKDAKLTSNASEVPVRGLLEADSQYVIPYFQREYKWERPRLTQLESDILNVVDYDTYHFLGAIIYNGRPGDTTEPRATDVIDGQQRYTTIFLYLCAAVKSLCEGKDFDTASSLFFKYLVFQRGVRAPTNSRLVPSRRDRAQLNAVFAELIADKDFKKHLGNWKFRRLPAVGPSTGQLYKNYEQAKKFFAEQSK